MLTHISCKIDQSAALNVLKDLKADEGNAEESAKNIMESLDSDKNGEIELWEVSYSDGLYSF